MKSSVLIRNAFKHFQKTKHATIYIPPDWLAVANIPENMSTEAVIVARYAMKKGVNLNKIDWAK